MAECDANIAADGGAGSLAVGAGGQFSTRNVDDSLEKGTLTECLSSVSGGSPAEGISFGWSKEPNKPSSHSPRTSPSLPKDGLKNHKRGPSHVQCPSRKSRSNGHDSVPMDIPLSPVQPGRPPLGLLSPSQRRTLRAPPGSSPRRKPLLSSQKSRLSPPSPVGNFRIHKRFPSKRRGQRKPLGLLSRRTHSLLTAGHAPYDTPKSSGLRSGHCRLSPSERSGERTKPGSASRSSHSLASRLEPHTSPRCLRCSPNQRGHSQSPSSSRGIGLQTPGLPSRSSDEGPTPPYCLMGATSRTGWSSYSSSSSSTSSHMWYRNEDTAKTLSNRPREWDECPGPHFPVNKDCQESETQSTETQKLRETQFQEGLSRDRQTQIESGKMLCSAIVEKQPPLPPAITLPPVPVQPLHGLEYNFGFQRQERQNTATCAERRSLAGPAANVVKVGNIPQPIPARVLCDLKPPPTQVENIPQPAPAPVPCDLKPPPTQVLFFPKKSRSSVSRDAKPPRSKARKRNRSRKGGDCDDDDDDLPPPPPPTTEAPPIAYFDVSCLPSGYGVVGVDSMKDIKKTLLLYGYK